MKMKHIIVQFFFFFFGRQIRNEFKKKEGHALPMSVVLRSCASDVGGVEGGGVVKVAPVDDREAVEVLAAGAPIRSPGSGAWKWGNCS